MIDREKVLSKIEPVAADNARRDDELIASIAISLKRIADMLDAVTTDSRFGIGIPVITNGEDQ